MFDENKNITPSDVEETSNEMAGKETTVENTATGEQSFLKTPEAEASELSFLKSPETETSEPAAVKTDESSTGEYSFLKTSEQVASEAEVSQADDIDDDEEGETTILNAEDMVNKETQASGLRAQMESLRSEKHLASEEPEEEQVEEAPVVQEETVVQEPVIKEVKPDKQAEKEEKAALKAAEKAAKAEAKEINKAAKAASKQASKDKTPKVKGKKKMQTYQYRQNKYGYAFMTPWIIGFLLFTLFPFVATIYLSFMNVKKAAIGYVIDFAGINNYVTAFVKNSKFLPALLSYLKMIIPYTFIVVVLSFIIAYLLNKIKTGKGILRTIYFLPVIIMSGPVMKQLLEVQDAAAEATAKITGAVDAAEQYSNIFIMQMIQSYSPPLATTLAEVFDQLSLILWFTGIPIVLFINGLQKINVSIYEAAKIDSANSWQIMWKITIPMLKQIGMIITIFTVIQLGTYESINPVYGLILQQTGDTSSGLGYAATYAWIYSLVVLAIIGVVLLLFRDRKPKDIKDRQKQEKKLAKLEKQQKRRLRQQNRYAKKEAKKYGK